MMLVIHCTLYVVLMHDALVQLCMHFITLSISSTMYVQLYIFMQATGYRLQAGSTCSYSYSYIHVDLQVCV